MPRYLYIWEIDASRMPADQSERMMIVKKMSDMTKEWLKDRPGSQWGLSLDGLQGYALSAPNASWLEFTTAVQMFLPNVKSKVFQVVSIEETDEILKSMMQMMQMKK